MEIPLHKYAISLNKNKNKISWSGDYVEYKFANERTADIIMSLLTTAVTFLFGGFDLAMQYLIVCNIIDVVTGIGSRYTRIGSRRFYAGVKKKVGFWVLVFVAHATDQVLIGQGEFAKSSIIMMLMGVELVSILENIYTWGVPQARFLSKYLVQVRERVEEQYTEVGRSIIEKQVVSSFDKDIKESGIENVSQYKKVKK